MNLGILILVKEVENGSVETNNEGESVVNRPHFLYRNATNEFVGPPYVDGSKLLYQHLRRVTPNGDARTKVRLHRAL